MSVDAGVFLEITESAAVEAVESTSGEVVELLLSEVVNVVELGTSEFLEIDDGRGPQGPQGPQGPPGLGAGDITAIAAALDAHIADTTSVHGISDALELDLRTEIGGVSPLQWYRNGKA